MRGGLTEKVKSKQRLPVREGLSETEDGGSTSGRRSRWWIDHFTSSVEWLSKLLSDVALLVLSWSCKTVLVFSDRVLYSMVFCKPVLPGCDLSIHCNSSFETQMLLILMTSTLPSFTFMFLVIWVLLRNLHLPQGHKYFLFSRSFIVLAFMFRSVFSFKFIFVYDVR